MKIKSTVMALIIFLVIFGGIGVTMALGAWTTTSTKEPAKYKDGANAGQANPADIRGSYTFADIEKAFMVDAKVLLAAFGFPTDKDPAQTKAKDLEAIYSGLAHEIGTDSVRVFVALYKNLPIELDDTYLPAPAIPLIVAGNTNLTAEQKAYLESHQVDPGPAAAGATGTPTQISTPAATVPTAAAAAPAATTPAPGATADAKPTTAATEPVVNGQSTFQQLLDAGITKAQIEQAIGAPMPPTNQSVKDYCSSKGISFSTVKNALNALVPAK